MKRTIADVSPAQALDALGSDASVALDRLVRGALGDVFPAATIAVVRGGEALLNRGWGWIDPDAQTLPVRPETLFDLASVTKLFTVSAFLSQVSEGRAALDDPLAGVIPEFAEGGSRPLDGGQDPHSKRMLPAPPEAAGRQADPAQVTFRQLLTHTSGLAPWRDVFNAAGPAPAPPDQIDLLPRAARWANGLRALCRYPFVGLPGDGVVRYSDLGLMLLGEAVARLDGRPGDLAPSLRARIFEPLGLASLTFNPLRAGRTRRAIAPTEDDPAWRGRRCWGEVHDENACGVGGVAGHAGLFGTARDVAAFGEAWRAGDPRLGIEPALRRAALQEQAATDGVRRGLGWLLKARADSSAGDRFSADAFGHTGFTGTSLWIDPACALVVAVLTNRVYPGREKPGIHAFRRAVHDLLAQGVDE